MDPGRRRSPDPRPWAARARMGRPPRRLAHGLARAPAGVAGRRCRCPHLAGGRGAGRVATRDSPVSTFAANGPTICVDGAKVGGILAESAVTGETELAYIGPARGSGLEPPDRGLDGPSGLGSRCRSHCAARRIPAAVPPRTMAQAGVGARHRGSVAMVARCPDTLGRSVRRCRRHRRRWPAKVSRSRSSTYRGGLIVETSTGPASGRVRRGRAPAAERCPRSSKTPCLPVG